MENKKEDKRENDKKYSKTGRPKKDKDKLKCSINLKLTAKDFTFIKRKATGLGMKATQYVREMALKGKVKSRFSIEELDLMRKLTGMANNLNQIARQANKSGFSVSAKEIISITAKIKKLLDDR